MLRDIRRLNAKGWDDQRIADHLGCSRFVIYRQRKRAGIPNRYVHRHQRIEPLLRELMGNGATWAEASKELGVCASQLHLLARRWGIKNAHGRYKLPDRDDEIRELNAKGWTDGQIADRLGCSISYVRNRRQAIGIATVLQQKYDKIKPILQELMGQGATLVDAAKRLRMHTSMVSELCKRWGIENQNARPSARWPQLRCFLTAEPLLDVLFESPSTWRDVAARTAFTRSEFTNQIHRLMLQGLVVDTGQTVVYGRGRPLHVYRLADGVRPAEG